MLLKFRCPQCRAEISLSDDQLREFLTCLHCGQKMRVPEQRRPHRHAEVLKAKEDFASSFSYAVAFKPAPVRTAAAAIELASRSETCRPPDSDSDGFYRVSYKPWAAGTLIELVSLLSGSEFRTSFNDQEVPFHKLRPSLACLRLRYAARDRDSYCRGDGRWPGAVFLCQKSGITNDGPQLWAYRYCSKGDDGKFHLDVDAFSAMVTERLREYIYCPFASGSYLRKAISRLEESIEGQTAACSAFLHPEFHADSPELRAENSTRGDLYQRVYVCADHCLECAVNHGIVHDGSGANVPCLPVHHGCRCLDLPIGSGESSHGYREFRELLPLLPKEEQAALVGEEQAALVRIGFSPENILDGVAAKDIADIARQVNTFAVSELSDDPKLTEKLQAIKGAKGVERDQKQWLRAVATARRSRGEGLAEKVAAQDLISRAARRSRR